MGEMIVFEKFLLQEDAEYPQQLLHQNIIKVELETPKTQFDAIVGQSRDNDFFIAKIAAQCFDAACRPLKKIYRKKASQPIINLWKWI